ncbi:hypothetical protein B0O80DRAFT_442686 [Mortierella sp. GBAus27b]|nr:hypothetical protein B0O80DRAFT_442686 [Mortierella sp. GBAus27b]
MRGAMIVVLLFTITVIVLSALLCAVSETDRGGLEPSVARAQRKVSCPCTFYCNQPILLVPLLLLLLWLSLKCP